MTNEERQEIRQMKKDGIPIRQVKGKFTHLNLSTVSNVYHGHDLVKRAKKPKKIVYEAKPFNSETCVIDGWRVIFDQDRKCGEVTTRQMTPEEREKYGPPNEKKGKGSYVITQSDIKRSLKRRGLLKEGMIC